MRNTIYYKIFSDAFGIALAVFCAAIGLESFLIPNGFLDGGVTGMSMLLSEVTKIPLSVFIIII
ncbi:MAG TPA: YitT family protein, partial [Spirochaetota bacterium]|nr:YitT family protein [Spirochaetota bacterium]